MLQITSVENKKNKCEAKVGIELSNRLGLSKTMHPFPHQKIISQCLEFTHMMYYPTAFLFCH